MVTVAALLAAGAGTRFGGSGAGHGHKLTARLGATTVFERSLAAALAAGVGPVVVVTGAVPLDVPEPAITVVNERWADGQATSLARAVDAAAALGAESIVVGLADQPGIGPDAWRAVACAAEDWPIVVATYAGRRGPHPVRLHHSLWHELPQAGDDGARRLIRDHPALVHEVACSGSPDDIDTLEDLQRWTSS